MRLREARKKARLSQQQVADYIGISQNTTQCELAKQLGVRQSTIAMWESGEVMPTADKFFLILSILSKYHRPFYQFT